MIVRHRHLIRYIQFGIELPRYSCPQCIREVPWRSTEEDIQSINDGVWKLLRIIGTWEKRQKHATNNTLPKGITLELNAYSPAIENTGSRTSILPLMRMSTMTATTRRTIRGTAGLTVNKWSGLLRRPSRDSSREFILLPENIFLQFLASHASSYAGVYGARFSLVLLVFC